MNNQMKVEVIHLRKSVLFYLAIAAFVVLSMMYSWKMVYTDMSNNSGIDAFVGTMSDTSLMFILSLFASYVIGNEFTNRTIDNEIRIGYSRFSVVLSRAIVVLPFTLIPYLAYTVTSTLFLGLANGFATAFTVSDLIIRFILFALQVMSIQSIAMFIMFACKKASLGMMVNTCFAVVTCNLLRNILQDNSLFKLTSFYRIMMNNQSMSVQDLLISFVSAIATLLLMVYASYIVFRKAELK